MRCIMHGQTAAAAPQIRQYVKESFPQYAVWEVCDAPKNDTLITSYFNYNNSWYAMAVYAYYAKTQTVTLLHSTKTWVQISVENGKIVATQSSGNADRACYVNLLA
ncbi:Uncharacterised protein [uncultured Butyricicoccus sp.]|nr:hypothetical protein [Agathobaculum ammoniilyticum]SCI83235.1 Uncharacterised protein [uncultured Butyricicoccus sp.]